MAYEMVGRSRGVFAAAWLNVLLGLVAVAIPFLFDADGLLPMWGNAVAGLLVVALAGYNVWAAWNVAASPMAWAAATNALLGIWLVVYPLLIDVPVGMRVANVALGVLIALVASYNAWSAALGRRVVPPARRSGL